MLSVNGRARLTRGRWHSPGEATTPLDAFVDIAPRTISLGVRELACRLNGDGKNFDKAAADVQRTAKVRISGETPRKLVESEGRCVLEAHRSEALAVGWSAGDCHAETGKTRVYFGCDGVMVPTMTDAEKQQRRKQVRRKRGQRGKKTRPLPPSKPWADQRYNEFKIIAYHDETQGHRLVCGTRGDHRVAGRLMRHQTARIRLDTADEKVGNLDGARWIRAQVQPQNLPLDALGLDFYHLGEHVHEARRAISGEDDKSGRRWAEALMSLEALTQSDHWDLYRASRLSATG
ncbi:MAG: hypothetical protein KGM43_01935 [Planctomycetota bacterium]|nr:hypothetical protein [Planctomycetota bacterium]